jgi:hypothetical protein
MSLKWADGLVLGTHISFRLGAAAPRGITERWDVLGERGDYLGTVKWYGPWHTYCFFVVNSIFEKVCLREIAEFCETLAKMHRDSRKAAKANGKSKKA